MNGSRDGGSVEMDARELWFCHKDSQMAEDSQRGGSVLGHDVIQCLCWIVEYYLVVLPRVNRHTVQWVNTRSSFRSRHDKVVLHRPRMKLEEMVNCQDFLVCFGDKEDLYLNLEFTPSCFRDFEGWFVDDCEMRGPFRCTATGIIPE